MSTYQTEIPIRTRERAHWIDMTDPVKSAVRASGITAGICMVSSMHTTAGVTLNENADPDVGRDFFWKLDQLVPREAAYRHSEGNSDSHLKAALVGFSITVPVKDAEPVLGTWQGMYLCEFDGPRQRRVTVTVIGEQNR